MADDEAIATLCSITGIDEQAAAQFLEASGGNVELAVGLAMDSNERPSSSNTAALKDVHDDDDVRQPIAPKRGVLIDSLNIGHDTTNWIDPLRRVGTGSTMSPFASFTDSLDLSTERGRRLAELYKTPTRIMFSGTFDGARKISKSQHRYLLVSLHDSSDFQCQMLNRDLWNNGEMQDFILDNLIFLQLVVGTDEADRYMRFYQFSGHPHTSLIDPRTGKLVKQWNIIPSPMDLIGEIIEYTEGHSLMKAHEINIPETIVIDDTDVEEVSISDQSAFVEEDDEEMQEEPPADAEGVTTLQFRLPDGNKIRRRFLQTQKIFEILKFAAKTLNTSQSAIQIFEHTRSLDDLDKDTSLIEAGLKNSSLTITLC